MSFHSCSIARQLANLQDLLMEEWTLKKNQKDLIVTIASSVLFFCEEFGIDIPASDAKPPY